MALCLLGTPAWADQAESYGWWWKAQPEIPAQVPPPPTVPDSGMYVSGDVSGPSAISAMRFTIGTDVAQAVVTLTIASTQGAPLLQLCPSTPAWSAELGGPYEHAPSYDCRTGSALGAVSADGTRVSFTLKAPPGPVLSVVVVPATDPGGANPVLSVSFNAPGPETLQLTTTPAQAAPASESEPGFGPPSSAPNDDIAALSPFVPGSAPPLDAPEPPLAAPVAQPIDDDTAGAVVTKAGQLGAKLSRSADADVRLGLLGLLVLAAVFFWGQAHPARGPRRLVSIAGIGPVGDVPVADAAEPALRGIGRFRKVRVGPAPRL